MALAISDTLFSVAIHPMLIATSFGVSPHELFGVSGKIDCVSHGLWTPNEGINQRYMKIWADVADKICFGRT